MAMPPPYSETPPVPAASAPPFSSAPLQPSAAYAGAPAQGIPVATSAGYPAPAAYPTAHAAAGGPPPAGAPGGYPGGAGTMHPVAIVQQSGIGGVALPMAPARASRYPMRVVCQFCRADVLTETRKVPGCFAHLICLFTFLCCVYCVDDALDVEHVCSNCHQVIARNNVMC